MSCIKCIKKTNCLSITNITQLILFITANSLYSEDHTKPINTLFGQNLNILSVKEEVPNSLCGEISSE